MYIKSLRTLAQHPRVGKVVLVVGEDYQEVCCQDIGQRLPEVSNQILYTAGGQERYHSVQRGLALLTKEMPEARYVLIHDGARPFVSPSLIEGVIQGMEIHGAAVPGLSPRDTIRTKEGSLKREELYAVQTPQGFSVELLQEAFRVAQEKGFQGTDDASYVDFLGHPVAITEGEAQNMKVTVASDLPIQYRTGIGYDVHRFVEEEETPPCEAIMLGGVAVPYTRRLLAHSDGDVLLHAITDALLGAAGEGDIGEHFPDKDPAYKNISSLLLLEQAGSLVAAKGWRVVNIDATLIGEAPRISPYKKEMAHCVAKALHLEDGQVNIKGTTTEKLGFTGRGEGLAAEAVCTLAAR